MERVSEAHEDIRWGVDESQVCSSAPLCLFSARKTKWDGAGEDGVILLRSARVWYMWDVAYYFLATLSAAII